MRSAVIQSWKSAHENSWCMRKTVRLTGWKWAIQRSVSSLLPPVISMQKRCLAIEASILKLGMVNPLPEKLILDFASKVEKLVIIEELDPIIENHCKQLGLLVTGKDVLPMEGEYSQNLIAEKLGVTVPVYKNLEETMPGRPPVMCAGCPHRYAPVLHPV